MNARSIFAALTRTHTRAAGAFDRWADQLAADIYISAAVREQRRRITRPQIGNFDTWPN